MDKYIELFWKLSNFTPRLNVIVHLYANRCDLKKARLDMTGDTLLKEIIASGRYDGTSGCYIMPPTSILNYDILLVDSDIFVYDLWHEMVHVCNYYNATQKGIDYMTMCTNAMYYNWDEFQARKISTIMFYKYVEFVSGEKYESQDMFNDLGKILRNEVPNSELMEDSTFRYNLVQYLGFVSATEEICKDFFELPTFIKRTPNVLAFYNELNEI